MYYKYIYIYITDAYKEILMFGWSYSKVSKGFSLYVASPTLNPDTTPAPGMVLLSLLSIASEN